MTPVLPRFPTDLSLLCRLCTPPTEHPCLHFKEEGKQNESAWHSLPCQLSGNRFASQEEIGCAKAWTFRQGPSALPLSPSKSPSGGLCTQGSFISKWLRGRHSPGEMAQ